MPSSMPAAFEFRGVSKCFGTGTTAVWANREVSFSVKAGTIHGLIGENGAGKSTTMKVLYGQHSPDAGEIYLNGQSVRWRSPSDAIAAGIGMVHQHFMLAGPYTVLDNIILGAEPMVRPAPAWWSTRWPIPWPIQWIDRRAARKRLTELSERYGLQVPLDARIESLPVGLQQRVEILKLLFRDARILILDEPTAVLTPSEVTDFFSQLVKLKNEGKSVVLITHKLKEVMAVTDHVTVMRAGNVVDSVVTRDSSVSELARKMVGREVALSNVSTRRMRTEGSTLGSPCLSVEGGRLGRLVVHGGEIVGIAGVEGNGQSDMLTAIVRPDTALKKSGLAVSSQLRVEIAGEPNSRAVRAKSMAVVPEDRHRDAMLLNSNLEENFLLGQQRRPSLSRFGWIRKRALRESFSIALAKFDVRPAFPEWPARGLSGGNQQKLVFARELSEGTPRLLVAAQPTRGVDIGAIEFIHDQIRAVRDQGAGVLLVSSELDEVLALADRVLVIYNGQFVREFSNAELAAHDRIETDLGLAMGGATV